MKRELTEKQCALINFLWEFYLNNDQLPPCHTICRHFGLASNNGAHERLESLCVAHRLLEKNALNKWKFTALARSSLLQGPYTSTQGEVMRDLASKVLQERAAA